MEDQADKKLSILYISDNPEMAKQGTMSYDRLTSYAPVFDMLYAIIFTPYGSGAKRERIGSNTWVYPTNAIFFLWNLISAWRIVAFQITWKFKLQANLIVADNPYYAGLVAYFIARRNKKRFVIRVGNDFLDPYWRGASLKNRIKAHFAKIVVREATLIEAASQKIKESLVEFDATLTNKISVVLPFVDVDKIAALPITVDIRKKYPEFGFIIVQKSELTRDKELGISLEVLRAIVKRYPKTGLVIVGRGPDKARLRRIASRYGLSGHVIFEPPTTDIFSYLKTANASLVTSRYEDHALELLEALACSCPVVTTPVGVARELLSMPPYSDFICPVGDANCFFERIRQIMEVSGFREGFRVNAKFIVSEKFGYTKEKYLGNIKDAWTKAFTL